MEALGRLALDLALLTLGYWAADQTFRLGGWARALSWLGLRSPAGQAFAWLLVCLTVTPLWPWTTVPGGGSLRVLATVLCAALIWRAVTRDIDVVTGEAHAVARVVLLASAAGTLLSPVWLLCACALLTIPLGMWQHHATLPLRILQALSAFVGLAALVRERSWLRSPDALVLLWVIIQVSHYVITALAKAYLGPRWYSWPLDNRLHHLLAAAYSWGWARFIPWPHVRRVIHGVRRVERPLQLMAFGIEALAPLAFLHPWAAIGLGLVWAAFHGGVFALSGLLFWEWIVTDLALAGLIWQLPAPVLAEAFGPGPLALGLLWLALFPLRHKLWKPMPLGWWDSPFTQRMHWRVRGRSGALYGLYAGFMDPHERIYGKVHACFLAPAPVLTYHLGEVFRRELRDGLRKAAGDPEQLDALRREFGIQPRDEQLAANHVAYLRRFCWELNRGARKHVLPRGLRFLKAPGGQCYYWGELPAYRRQESIVGVEIVYREEYFDGDTLRRLRDESVLHIPIDNTPTAPAAATEPTPKQLDDHLLSFAAGRLIRLPGLGQGFIRGDDGTPGPRR